ncbi:SslE/AcfD family lipoprotein zinc metalloprotease [Photobacterium sanguinicancri]|uniref:SslE/AcfD family lipoprotein zinc metalloprotease n=1 Tax=Photobacterium sanguinicancri TaxID=875932 RepID=UPI0026E39545|nr:SslE/AcfD family lipoprotein zinc metalloprotease [Photobacterium sanguinicancri]MDO6498243.1 SslE/AcfD family lipoprotein zinc metalloprotease [Photobacterium sanguinicancri]
MISLSSINKNILALAIASTFLSGCNDDTATGNTIIPEDIKPPTETIPPTDILPPIETIPPTEIIPTTTYVGSLLASGKMIKGDVDCNGVRLTDGTFEVSQGTPFSCTLGSVILGDFTAPFPPTSQSKSLTTAANNTVETSFELTRQHGENAATVLQSIDSCETDEALCLNEIDSFGIEDVYQQVDNKDVVEAYFESLEEKATDEVGKAPSSHVDDTVVPAVDPSANNDLNSNFVSANAEASYTYKPSADAQVLTRSKLTDNSGKNSKPIAGVSFFSAHSTGVTDENGEFEYLWGDTITFGIDTFEFGKVLGNQVDYKLTDVTDNAVTKANIQALIERYAASTGNAFTITPEIHETFAQYPNVINELINLALPSGGKLGDSNYEVPNEFEAQFSEGLTAIIDGELNQNPITYRAISLPNTLSVDNGGKYVTESLTKIFTGVDSFHVFNDNGSFYGASGYTRGMRALNISNEAFPIMMPRTDKNHEIPFGKQQAWTREGKPYIAEYPGIQMQPIPLVSKDNATYGFPFVTAGSIGTGKVVFMGNGMYPSILSCPDNYWANRALHIDSTNQTCTVNTVENPLHDDHGNMKRFFANLFQWFNNGTPTTGIKVATNIDSAYAAYHHSTLGRQYDFFVSPKYGFSAVEKLSKGGFSGLSATETPILLLQAYPPRLIQDGMTNLFVADLENPNLSQDDITALIKYINDGGNVLFMDAIQATNPEPIGRLADAAGVSLGGQNVTPTNQAFCGSSYYCQAPYPNLHVKSQKDMVVLERFQDNQGEQPFTVHQDGTVEWIKDETKIKFEIPTYEMPKLNADGTPELDANGAPVMVTKQARIFVDTAEQREAAIAELEKAFEGTPVCTNKYEYEFNCIETRAGDGVTVRGSYYRADFDRYPVSKDVIESMVKAANLGSNFTALYNHEIYYRSKGTQGIRLSKAELNQTYDNLSVWMWNDNPYRYQTGVQDELGFKQAVQFLNCYTDGQHQVNAGEANCPVDLKASLVANEMIHGDGELSGQLNPSYPLNYMEKPLTRIMLGRSYWDHEITVDTTMYPGRTAGAGSSGTATIQTNGKAVSYSAGNNQSTGLWAPQLQEVTVSGGVEARITVMMADDLTGKPNHEVSLKRPPRMQTSYHYDGTSLSFKAPYGGLIYVQPKVKDQGTATFNFSNVETAAWWKDGNWVNMPSSAAAPIAELDTGSFIYTTPINNVRNSNSADLNKFANDMNRFADAASDFYGRDEVVADGQHRRFTYSTLDGFRHRFVNDVQISIGAAHSGYPVMNSSFNTDRTSIPTNALNDWLIWHEVGHNLASAPFSAQGSTEVTNNLLALYMQELEGRNDNPQMDRIATDIQKAPMWLNANGDHAWANGDAGMRLVMFGQLKIWAKNHFSLDNWYANDDHKPAIYGKDAGWNMIKLMHRKARGDVQGDTLQGRNGTNYCSPQETGLSGGDLMMVCSSYVSGYDLSDFFTTWNVGESSMTNPDGTKVYNGGISSNALALLSQLKLDKPTDSPLKVNSLNYGK